MGVHVGDIDLGLNVNQKMFNSQLSGIAGGATKSAMKIFSSLGGTIGFTLGAAALASLAKDSIELGSNLIEVQNVVDTVFPNMNNQVNNFARNAMEQFGLSETAAKKYTSTFGAMSKAMGFTEQQSYKMATSVAGMTGDVASFYNLSTDEAYTKLKSIWTGETESLRDLGIVMTQANLDQYALNEGLGKTTKTMSEQEKAMLRYRYVMSRLSDASGDFAKTSDSWANQMRILNLQFDSLKATLGKGLIQLLLPIVKGLNTVLSYLNKILAKIGEIYRAVSGKELVQSNNNIATSAMDAFNAELGLADGIGEASSAAKKALAPFDELNLIQSGLGSSDVGMFDNWDFSENEEVVSGAEESKNKVRGLKDEMDDFFLVIEDHFNRLNFMMAQPMYVPSPIFAEIPNPVYKPNWGFNLPPMPVPEFQPIPSPIYSPNWNLNNSLVAETGLVAKTMEIFSADTLKNLSMTFAAINTMYSMSGKQLEITSEGIKINSNELGNTVEENTKRWVKNSAKSLVSWGIATASIVYQTAKGGIQNVNSWLRTTDANIRSWITGTASNFATWGTGVLQTAASTAKGFVANFVSGLRTAWDNFRSYMKSVGEKVSGWWSENKEVAIPVMKVAVIGGLALGALALSGGSLAPAAAAFSASAIPAFANGGLVSAPTLAMVGDNKNAATDPEVIAPLSKLQGMLEQNSGNQEMVTILREILDAIREGQIMMVDRKVLAQVVTEAMGSTNRMAGRTVLNL